MLSMNPLHNSLNTVQDDSLNMNVTGRKQNCVVTAMTVANISSCKAILGTNHDTILKSIINL
jgi:hypothetical protein